MAQTSPRHHLLDRGDGTVADSDSGLTWQQGEAAVAMDWLSAVSHAEGLELGGFHDWRLPNIKELRSLNDESLANPSLDLRFFPAAKGERYWSSTTQNHRSTNAWWTDFGVGTTSQGPKTSRYWVRAVRGGLSNAPPVLQPRSDLELGPGQRWVLTNAATDAETTSQRLTYRLLNVPAGCRCSVMQDRTMPSSAPRTSCDGCC